MSWAKQAKEKLQSGEKAVIYPKGSSMKPLVFSGQKVVLLPLLKEEKKDLKTDDIVLVTVRGRDYLHLVSGVREGQVQISNNRGHINGWVSFDKVWGIMDRSRTSKEKIKEK